MGLDTAGDSNLNRVLSDSSNVRWIDVCYKGEPKPKRALCCRFDIMAVRGRDRYLTRT